jgi:hypothetical protein
VVHFPKLAVATVDLVVVVRWLETLTEQARQTKATTEETAPTQQLTQQQVVAVAVLARLVQILPDSKQVLEVLE